LSGAHEIRGRRQTGAIGPAVRSYTNGAKVIGRHLASIFSFDTCPNVFDVVVCDVRALDGSATCVAASYLAATIYGDTQCSDNYCVIWFEMIKAAKCWNML
jgi:hypothetical protein